MLGAMSSEEELPGTPSGDSIDREIGEIVRTERIARGLSAEEAARRAKVAYKTWKRIEDGEPVRRLSLAGVDRLFGLPAGTTQQAKNDVFRFGLDLRAQIQRAAEAGPRTATQAGTANLHLRTSGGHEHVLGRAVETDTAGALVLSDTPGGVTLSSREELAAAAAFLSRQGEVAPRRQVTTADLVDRILGLELEDLERLRDLVDGAVLTSRFPNIEQDLTHASAAAKAATQALDAAREKENARQMELGAMTRRANFPEAGADDEQIELELEAMKQRVKHATDSVIDAAVAQRRAQQRYAHLADVHARIQKFLSTKMEVPLGGDSSGER